MNSYLVSLTTVVSVGLSFFFFLRQKQKQKNTSQLQQLLQTHHHHSITAPASSQPATIVETEKKKTNIKICFGSQTGTAENFASILADEGTEAGFCTEVVDLEEYDANEIESEKCLIFIMATYGEGEPTDNAIEFTKFLRHTKTPNLLSNLDFAVFGCGNKQYEQYNFMGRLYDKKLEKHGGKRVFEYGEGDDDGSLEDDFDNWKKELWPTLQDKYMTEKAASSNTKINAVGEKKIEFLVEFLPAPAEENIFEPEQIQKSNKHYFSFHEANVVKHYELRQDTVNGSTVHIEFDLKKIQLPYETADNLAILPENSLDLVESVANRMGYDLTQWVHVIPQHQHKQPFPTPCSIGQILSWYLDLNNYPRKKLLSDFSYFATDKVEQDKMLYLCSIEGQQQYQETVVQKHWNVGSVLEHFPSVKIPFHYFIQMCPFLQPRYYTISSSSLVNPDRIHATVSVISDQQNQFYGVCSNQVAKLSPLTKEFPKKKKKGTKYGEQGSFQPRKWPSIRFFIRRSSFKLPVKASCPILMIGPGTGIAPMRAFLHERKQLSCDGESVGKNILYFGCRKSTEDYLYKKELEGFQKEGFLHELHVAFSREKSNKVYVQHLLANNSSSIKDLILKDEVYIYVCGGTSMGHDVHTALEDILGGEDKNVLKLMQQNGRYVQELWA